MVSSHLSLFLFANLITSFAYGEVDSCLACTRYIVILGIAVTLFVKSIGTILRKRSRTGKLNYPLVLPSVLIFLFATLVSSVAFRSQCWFETLSPSECSWFMGQHMEDLRCLRTRPRVLSWPHPNAGEDSFPDRPSGSHNSGRCSGGTVVSDSVDSRKAQWSETLGLPYVDCVESQLLCHRDTFLDFRGDIQ
jgi:hypothetical protein